MEWRKEVRSKINLYEKIPEDYSGGEENIVSLYEILVKQDWVEQDKMWEEKYTGVICFIDILVKDTNILISMSNCNNLNIKSPSKKILHNTRIKNSLFKLKGH